MKTFENVDLRAITVGTFKVAFIGIWLFLLLIAIFAIVRVPALVSLCFVLLVIALVLTAISMVVGWIIGDFEPFY